jgi:hypothetical protein
MKSNRRFLILWSLISPACLAPIVWILSLTNNRWYPTANIWLSIVIYLAYWLPLGFFQGLLISKFQSKKIDYRWFAITSITGFILLLGHDLSAVILNADTRGQGALYLLLSLPFLLCIGGIGLSVAQLLLFQADGRRTKNVNLSIGWLVGGFISWSMGFLGIFFTSFISPVLMPQLVFLISFTVGAAIKGFCVMKYLNGVRSR